jgi:GNAT superfamily N-acetyltransferase
VPSGETSPPPRGGVDIRAAQPGEGASLTQLVFESKRFWGYDDAFMERCRSELVVPESDIAAGHVYVAVDEHDEALGVYVVKEVSEGEAELDSLFVSPSHMRAGVGAALLAHAMNEARRDGYATMRLDSDPFAAIFYEREGATLIGRATSKSTGRELPRYEFRL